MLLISHIIIALSSVFYTAFALFFPSKNKLNIAYTLTGLTIATGTYLAITTPHNITQTCETGLAYIGLMLIGIFIIRYKLATTAN